MRRFNESIVEGKEAGVNNMIPANFLIKSEGEVYPQIGYEFEFYSNTNIEKLCKILCKLIGVEVKLDLSSNKQSELGYYLQYDYSGGKGMVEFITPPVKLEESWSLLEKTLGFIKEHGFTNDKCAFQFNLSFTNVDISRINILKMCVNFNEDFVYDRFPNRIGNHYTKSIKNVLPKSAFNVNKNMDVYNFQVPNDKYFGINFKKLLKNYLEYRYMGGTDYEYKYTEIKDVIIHFKNFLIATLNDNELNDDDIAKIEEINTKYDRIRESLKTYTILKKNFPNIVLKINLASNDKMIDVHWNMIKPKLDMLLRNGMKVGKLNYDSNSGILEVKDAKIGDKISAIDGLKFFNCEIQANLNNCDLYKCDVKLMHMVNCNVYKCNMENIKLMDCVVDKDSDVRNSYIDISHGVFNGFAHECIVRNMCLGIDARVENDCELIAINTEKYFMPR